MNKNDNIKRLLCIVGSMDAGGAETFLMKVYRNINRNNYQMDFCVSTQEEGFYDKEIQILGGKIFHSTPKSRGIIKSFKALQNIVKTENYNCVMRVSQHSLSALDLLAAKFGGAKILVYRSSNSGTCGGKKNLILHKLFKWLAITIPTLKIAPSTEAAEFVFGHKCINNKKALIIKNAIAVDDFLFEQSKRDKIREEFNLGNKFVVGHVGRFSKQKNHSFLIEIFAEIERKHKNSVLILVGKGELENDIKKKIEICELTDKVIFTGVRSDVPDIMMAMDVFIFPSVFEGMPNTVIEAQATGLECIVSDVITKEAKITSLVDYLSLQDDAKLWSTKALKYIYRYERKNMKDDYEGAGYDISLVAKEFINLIFGEDTNL